MHDDSCLVYPCFPYVGSRSSFLSVALNLSVNPSSYRVQCHKCGKKRGSAGDAVVNEFNRRGKSMRTAGDYGGPGNSYIFPQPAVRKGDSWPVHRVHTISGSVRNPATCAWMSGDQIITPKSNVPVCAVRASGPQGFPEFLF